MGEHILLGGDNIDLALAHTVAGELAAKGTKIDALPAAGALEQLPPRQRKAARSGIERRRSAGHDPRQRLQPDRRHDQSQTAPRADRAGARRFFPACREHGHAAAGARAPALQEMGLPYASDAAITRHLARFLRQQARLEHDPCGAARAACLPHARPVQRRRAACAVRARASARSAERLACARKASRRCSRFRAKI